MGSLRLALAIAGLARPPPTVIPHCSIDPNGAGQELTIVEMP